MQAIGLALLIVFLSTPVWAAPPSGPDFDAIEVEKLADGLAFTEGPAADREGKVYFTDQPNNRILVWDTDDTLSTFMEPSGRANGLYVDKEGALWACADARNELWRIDSDGQHTVVVSAYEGKRLNGPNDVWVAPDGAVYFTDPYYRRDYWDRGPAEQPVEAVYRVSRDGTEVQRVADDFEKPNGLVGSSDGTMLYVADIGAGKTYRYRIAPDGALVEKALFCDQGSDGMTLDRLGNVYLTGKGVTVYDSTGSKLGHIDVDAPWTANVCFGGPSHSDLYITASTGLYRVKSLIPPPQSR